jgi:energy-converting hydrogenase Eha subunit C
MKGLKKPLRKIAILSLLMVCFVAILAVTLWLYTATQLRIARIEGVYSSP